MATLTTAQKKVFEDFKTYPWLEDKVFQSGVHTILRSMGPTNQEKQLNQDTKTPVNQDYDSFYHDSQNTLQLLRAKHFYYSKFKQSFDFGQYLDYELEQQKEQERLENIAKYERMEKYDFDNDEKYIKGLPNIIKSWVLQQVQDSKTGKLWDKTHLDAEFVKAKAFYYSACIEHVDVIDYLTWKNAKEQKEEPACPFANLWQNKGKADLGPQVIAEEFLSVEASKFGGPTTITLASPHSQNMITIARLNQLEKALNEVYLDDNNDTSGNEVTSVLMTATVVDNSDWTTATDDRIGTKDTKMISSGLAYEATYQHLKQESDDNESKIIRALDHLGAAYYKFVRHQHLQPPPSTSKPTFTFINGQVPLDLSYVTLWHGYLRVATEHALFQCDMKPSHAPIPPLLLFQISDNRIKASNNKPSLPAGWDVYLALAPPDLGRLRAPELLRLGLVDVFVPENQLTDVFSNAKRMALCPPPLTSTAVQLALALHHSYPGPERINTWQKEISQIFGSDETSLHAIVSQLKQMDNPWSRKILDHWASLPPTLIKVVLKAARLARTMAPLEILTLEERLNRQWRHSPDYQQFLRGETNWQGSLDEEECNDVDDEDALLAFYFDDDETPNSINTDNAKDEPFVYQVSEKDMVVPASTTTESVCPVTGQRSGNNNTMAGGCPMAAKQQQQQQSVPANGGVCPVTGQKSSDNTSVAAACPMAGDQQQPPLGSDAVCPITGQSNGTCPANAAQNVG
ncbi:hypothetical protein BCR42DRAFT_453181 [Absidia repens]|uniref:Uncharacterized protein n=1 Tax=Absidia repens TaxID=90262 RepID=A0A1X2IB73_9FUNG|nr:hypothetical protein BCR42DRAFT_453181 [Absidia repens]